uniref:hypothetical protein n=1 Tax=Mycobacteroides abscessus TaxID=36809 RepID=UPI001F1F626F
QPTRHPNHRPTAADRSTPSIMKSREWTACMDYAWTSEGCISVAPDKVVRAECDDKNLPNRERPITILFNTIDTSRCLFGGFAHPVRRFTVCTETQK